MGLFILSGLLKYMNMFEMKLVIIVWDVKLRMIFVIFVVVIIVESFLFSLVMLRVMKNVSVMKV